MSTKKKVVIAPDSFKGTLSSRQICEIISSSLIKNHGELEIFNVPIADGGEGSLDCFRMSGDWETVYCVVQDALGRDIQIEYIVNNNKAVIETAKIIGLDIVGDLKNPLITNTYGVGQAITDALNRNCNEITVTLGGSSTNDGGTAMASALGVQFLNKNFQIFVPNGETLKDICSIDISNIDKRLYNCKFTAMCDVKNKLYGLDGAAHVYAPQKGANNDAVKTLDSGLHNLSNVIDSDLNIDVSVLEGGGAAGGLGAGIVAFLNGKLLRGIDCILELVEFNKICTNANLIITGEGKLDSQTFNDKAILGMLNYLKIHQINVPVLAIVGENDCSNEQIFRLEEMGIIGVLETNASRNDFRSIKKTCGADLAKIVDEINLLDYFQLDTNAEKLYN